MKAGKLDCWTPDEGVITVKRLCLHCLRKGLVSLPPTPPHPPQAWGSRLKAVQHGWTIHSHIHPNLLSAGVHFTPSLFPWPVPGTHRPKFHSQQGRQPHLQVSERKKHTPLRKAARISLLPWPPCKKPIIKFRVSTSNFPWVSTCKWEKKWGCFLWHFLKQLVMIYDINIKWPW